MARSQRTRTLAQNIAAAFSGRAINLASTVITVPLTIHALGPEQYGVLAIVLSLTTFFAYADFGLGLAIVNEVAAAEAKRDHDSVRRAITQAWAFLWAAAFLVVTLGAIAALCGVVHKIFPSLPQEEILPVWATLVGCSALGIPFALSQRIMFALQMGVIAQIWGTAGRIIVVLGALAASLWSPNLVVFVAVFLGLPVLTSVLLTLHLFWHLKPECRPRRSAFDIDGLRSRVVVGLQFSLLHVSNFVESGIDPLIMAQFFPAATIAQFDLVSRLFGYIPALASIALGPFWPALRGALEAGDHAWFAAANRRMGLGVVVTSVCAALVVVMFCESFVKIWTGVSLTLNHLSSLEIAFGVWGCLSVFVLFQGMILTSLGNIRDQAYLSQAVSAAVLLGKVFAYGFGDIALAIVVMIVGNIARSIVSQQLIERGLMETGQAKVV